jgi:hypothetical protein
VQLPSPQERIITFIISFDVHAFNVPPYNDQIKIQQEDILSSLNFPG